MVLLAYLPALRGGFVWDDDKYVTENLTLRDWNGLGRIWFQIGAVPQYYPLVFTSFWVEYRLWGLAPFGYHLVNALIHACAAVLLWRAALRLPVPGAWLAAMIFALHPVQVESVAWITERKNVMSALFYFAAALFYLRFLAPNHVGEGGRTRWRWYAAAMFFFILALLSKSVTCTLPAAMLLVCWWRNGAVKWSDVARCAPFLAVGVASGLLTTWIERYLVGASGSEWSASLAERLLIAGRALCFYAGKLAWPTGLAFSYPRWNIDAASWWQWTFPIAIVAVVLALWLARRRLGRGPLAAVLFFGGTLGPALGFINVYPMRFSFVADHFQYLASVGLILLCAAWLSRRSPLVPATLLVVLAALTWQQAGVYRSYETLLRDTLAKSPESWMAHNNLGLLLHDLGNLQEAESHYRSALEINPDEGIAQYNLANLLAETGRRDEAIARYRQALVLEPNEASIHINLGRSLKAQGNFKEAESHYREAIRVKPDEGVAQYNLANLMADTGRRAEAIALYRHAAKSRPDDASIYNNLGAELFADGQFEQAVMEFRQALEYNPESAIYHSNLADALLALNRRGEAILQYQEALRLDPDCAPAKEQLRNLNGTDIGPKATP